jgi:hypothetical protein
MDAVKPKPATSYMEAATPNAVKQKTAKPKEVVPEDIKPHPAAFSWRIIAACAIPVGLLTTASLWLNLDRDLVVYVLLASLMLVTLTIVLSQGALLYGLSRAQDDRPTPRGQWWRAARSGFMDVMNVDLVTVISALTMLSLGFGLWKLAGNLPEQPVVLRAGVLVVGNALLGWALIGAIAARHLAIPAVVIGGLPAFQGIKLGWETYRKAGGHLVLALTETLVARLAVLLILVTGGFAVARYVEHWNHEVIAVVTGAGVAAVIAATFFFLLQIEARVWLKQYRYWISQYHPNERLRLLAGRMQTSTRR